MPLLGLPPSLGLSAPLGQIQGLVRSPLGLLSSSQEAATALPGQLSSIAASPSLGQQIQDDFLGYVSSNPELSAALQAPQNLPLSPVRARFRHLLQDERISQSLTPPSLDGDIVPSMPPNPLSSDRLLPDGAQPNVPSLDIPSLPQYPSLAPESLAQLSEQPPLSQFLPSEPDLPVDQESFKSLFQRGREQLPPSLQDHLAETIQSQLPSHLRNLDPRDITEPRWPIQRRSLPDLSSLDPSILPSIAPQQPDPSLDSPDSASTLPRPSSPPDIATKPSHATTPSSDRSGLVKSTTEENADLSRSETPGAVVPPDSSPAAPPIQADTLEPLGSNIIPHQLPTSPSAFDPQTDIHTPSLPLSSPPEVQTTKSDVVVPSHDLIEQISEGTIQALPDDLSQQQINNTLGESSIDSDGSEAIAPRFNPTVEARSTLQRQLDVAQDSVPNAEAFINSPISESLQLFPQMDMSPHDRLQTRLELPTVPSNIERAPETILPPDIFDAGQSTPQEFLPIRETGAIAPDVNPRLEPLSTMPMLNLLQRVENPDSVIPPFHLDAPSQKIQPFVNPSFVPPLDSRTNTLATNLPLGKIMPEVQAQNLPGLSPAREGIDALEIPSPSTPNPDTDIPPDPAPRAIQSKFIQDLQRLPSPDLESPPYSGERPKSDRPDPISPSLPQLPSTDISSVDQPPATIQPSLLTKLDQQISRRDQSLRELDSTAATPNIATDALDIPSLVQRSPLGAYQSLLPSLNMLGDVKDQIPELDDLPQDLTAAQQPLEKLPIPSQATEGLNALATNTPSNWSSLEDLLGKTVQQEGQNVTDGLTKTEPWSDYFEQQSPLTETLMSPMTALRSESDNNPLTTFINPMTQTLPQVLKGGGDIDAQKLEVLAQVIYLLLRDRLSLEQERQSFQTFTPLPWLNVVNHSNTALTSGESKESHSLERINIVLIGNDLQAGTQLADLCQEVYYMIHLRLQREQERLGLYYSS